MLQIKLFVTIVILLYFNKTCDGAKRVKRIVGGMMAALPPPDDPVIFTRAYSRNARVEGFRYLDLSANKCYFPLPVIISFV